MTYEEILAALKAKNPDALLLEPRDIYDPCIVDMTDAPDDHWPREPGFTVAVYMIYTLDPRTAAFFGTPYLAFTAPFTLFGVGRFLFLVSNRPNSESPTEEMLRDLPFLLNLAFWAVTVVAVIYVGQG